MRPATAAWPLKSRRSSRRRLSFTSPALNILILPTLRTTRARALEIKP